MSSWMSWPDPVSAQSSSDTQTPSGSTEEEVGAQEPERQPWGMPTEPPKAVSCPPWVSVLPEYSAGWTLDLTSDSLP